MKSRDDLSLAKLEQMRRDIDALMGFEIERLALEHLRSLSRREPKKEWLFVSKAGEYSFGEVVEGKDYKTSKNYNIINQFDRLIAEHGVSILPTIRMAVQEQAVKERVTDW